jgi:predicted negative regulator of RcsB-dependent stress response
VDKVTRRELKRDPLALEVQHSVEYVSGHRLQIVKIAGAVVVVLLIAAGVYFYRHNQAEDRQEELAKAIEIGQAGVAPNVAPGQPSYPSQSAKEAAEKKAFTDLAVKASGTDEGSVAQFYLASSAADKGSVDEAEKRFKDVVDNGSGPYVSLAKLSLAKIYNSKGKFADAEALVRSVIDKPTAMVSKESATIALAHLIAARKPKEAMSLLGPLRANERPAVSKAAIDSISELKLQ